MRKTDSLISLNAHHRVMEEYESFSTYLVANGVDTEVFSFEEKQSYGKKIYCLLKLMLCQT